jgi:hypothetical protein
VKAPKALAGLYGAKEREQSICTPQPIVDALLRLWPEGITCDPCSCDASIVPAALRIDAEQNGLSFSMWPLRTYVNPPYDKLRPWIERFMRSWECVLLVPVRPHRKLWRPLWDPSVVRCWLEPVKFIGFDQAMPIPLVLAYRGERDFAAATEGIGYVT